MPYTKTTFVDLDVTKKVTASFLNTLQDWLMAHKAQHAPGGTDSVFPATGSAGYVHQAADGTLSLTNPAGSGDVVGPDEAIDGHIAVFDGTTGKLLKDGGAPGGGGGGGWTALTATTDFATTAPGTNTVTMNTDQTANIKVGYALKYTYNGTTYYGVVSAITSSLLTFSGPAISTGAGLLTAISWADSSHIRTIPILYVGYWNDGTNTQILAQKFGIPGHWKLGPAYLAQIGYQVNTVDSGATQPTANFAVNGNNVLTSAITPTASYQVTGGIISSTYYAITNGQTFDVIVASDGTNKNSWTIWIDTVWVLP